MSNLVVIPGKMEDIDKILKTYQMKNYNEFELLKRSGAKLPTDNFEFIMPNKIS